LNVGAVIGRRRRPLGRNQPPAALAQKVRVGRVSLVDVERQLHLDARGGGKPRERPHLVRAKAVALSLELDRLEGAAPGGDARVGAAAGARRPLLEDDRLRRPHPLDAAGGHRAALQPHPEADRRVGVVIPEGAVQPQLLPHLREARVDVEEDAAAGGGEHLLVGEEAHRVDQHGRAAHPLERLPPGQTGGRARSAVVEQEAPVALEPLGRHRRAQPLHLNRGRPLGARGQHLAGEAVEEEDLVAEPPEPD
jgi:hypothetical protein